MKNINQDNNTTYATHGLHSYAAKCPPQLVQAGIERYSKIGDLVLDPMVGSGTTAVEGILHSRNVIGFDIDPLACLITRVKTRYIHDESIVHGYGLVRNKVMKDIEKLNSRQNNLSLLKRVRAPINFPNLEHWFSPQVISNLALLSYHIATTPLKPEVKDFLWVAFSGTIISKVSVANARDIIHSRSHYHEHAKPPDVIAKFDSRIKKMRRHMLELHHFLNGKLATADIRLGDARNLSLTSGTVDLVFTSPPYATALDYQRAHFLAVGWMQAALNVSVEEYRLDGSKYIGSEKGKVISYDMDGFSKYDIVPSVIAQLEKVDKRKAFLLYRYFTDMKQVISEISRVLKPRKHAIIVVCPSHIRKVQIPNHEALAEIGDSFGLKLVEKRVRTIEIKKRVLPYVREAFGDRMSTEYVLVFQKRRGRGRD